MKIIPGNRIISERLPIEVYKPILDAMPLLCVDVVAYRGNRDGRSILMLERMEKPAKGLLWFPGGRLFKNESLEDAAKRKLREECGITRITLEKQIGAFSFSSHDGIFPDLKDGFHAVVIDYLVKVEDDTDMKVDDTSGGYKWLRREDLNRQRLHPYIAEVLNASRVFGRKSFVNIDHTYEK